MDQRDDRRGDRRETTEWTCPRTVQRITEDPALGCRAERAELPDGTVYCATCGAVDQRGTEGNRRQAAQDLGRLLERIERDMGDFGRRLRALEDRRPSGGALIAYDVLTGGGVR
jgi:hypothetical protein